MKNLLTALLVLTLFISCTKDKTEPVIDYTAKNEQEIKDYITNNYLSAQRTAEGLYYVINYQGTGKQATATSNVTVAYKGYFTNRTVFDHNDAGYTTYLNNVIKGWTQGIPFFKAGGSGILLIPSSLGYGSSTNGTIPGGSVLIFDINLISVN